MDILQFLEKGIWFGLAGVGFAILFNVPSKNLATIFIMGALGGLTKTISMGHGANIVFGSLAGATLVGFLSIYFAHRRHTPAPILAIPSVIPMIPGILIYRMIISMTLLASEVDHPDYQRSLHEAVNYGVKVLFILASLAGGVAIPMLITRKQSAKEMHFRSKTHHSS